MTPISRRVRRQGAAPRCVRRSRWRDASYRPRPTANRRSSMLGSRTGGVTKSCDSPATLTLESGGSFSPARLNPAAERRAASCCALTSARCPGSGRPRRGAGGRSACGRGKLGVGAESASEKDGGLHEGDRRGGQAAGQIFAHLSRNRGACAGETDGAAGAPAIEQGEGYLGVEDRLRHGLQGQELHCLIFEFVDAGLAAVGNGREKGDREASQWKWLAARRRENTPQWPGQRARCTR